MSLNKTKEAWMSLNEVKWPQTCSKWSYVSSIEPKWVQILTKHLPVMHTSVRQYATIFKAA